MLAFAAFLLAVIIASRWLWFSVTLDSWTGTLSGNTLSLVYSPETRRNASTRLDAATGVSQRWEWWTWERTIGQSRWLSAADQTSVTVMAAWPLILPPLAVGLYLRTRGVLALLRKPPWCCRSCGYDLRGLDPGAACPECGARPRLNDLPTASGRQ